MRSGAWWLDPKRGRMINFITSFRIPYRTMAKYRNPVTMTNRVFDDRNRRVQWRVFT